MLHTSKNSWLFSGISLSNDSFDKIARKYTRETGFQLAAIDTRGHLIRGKVPCSANADLLSDIFRQATEESLRWGEPCIMTCPCGHILWSVPVMCNQKLAGGLLVGGVPLETSGPRGAFDKKILESSRRLLALAIENNLTNAALLENNRAVAERESGRAETLHDLKDHLYDEIRSAYLHEEPSLLAAIQRGERTEARAIINRILTAIYARSAGRPNLLKTLALELVIMMARAAVQAGADPEKILGINYRSLTELSLMDANEGLANWLCEMLELLIDAIGQTPAHPNAVQLARAVSYMELHYAEDLCRDDVALAAGLSPSHFSHLMKEKVGISFTNLLHRIRLDNARRLLARDHASIAQIAQACGFSDQSYFSRIFRKTFNETPADYRRRIQENQ